MNLRAPRSCGVPQCPITSIKYPNKLFVFVPQKKTIRAKWLKLAKRDSKGLSPNSHLYFCEDHFDLPNDMENYMEYHLMGSVAAVRIKPGCLPSKFECQLGRRKRTSNAEDRPYIVKKQIKTLIEECEKYLGESPIVGKDVKLADTSSGNSVPTIIPIAEDLQEDELNRTMLNVENMKKCFLCSEEYSKIVSLQQCMNERDNLSVAQALQSLNFLPISDATMLQGSICFICVAKIQSCYEFKDLCGQIDSALLSVNEKENESSNTSRFLLIDNIQFEVVHDNGEQNICTLSSVKNDHYEKLITSEIHTESIKTIKNEDSQQNFEISTQISTMNSKVKSEIEMDEGSFYSTKENSCEKNTTEEYDSGKFNVIECQENSNIDEGIFPSNKETTREENTTEENNLGKLNVIESLKNSNMFCNAEVSTQIAIAKNEPIIQTDTIQKVWIIQDENTGKNYFIKNSVYEKFNLTKPEDTNSTEVLPNSVPVMQAPFTINTSLGIENKIIKGTSFKRVENFKNLESINSTHHPYTYNRYDEKCNYHKVNHRPKILKNQPKMKRK